MHATLENALLVEGPKSTQGRPHFALVGLGVELEATCKFVRVHDEELVGAAWQGCEVGC